ncbi:RNA polymerase sigma-70 factor, ECF subfamily [Muriicola jejuensis]|uniref:Sigma-70 family RNA polymerase sigma factor n=1 Tax=Muriicola jejuensis TaxID=504488 RepID=A0A6P0UCL7_9FLAO|nr:RNA polymerase sigma factor [Muriicola jejuensis]NER10787.1 sigma-70 family RNA polymerase sigma factor [Muriicola jejuensis]SMP16252.1 RNA polymerase sigma-70 factor, ECF subfamily [Muriicola jejuensis]
MNLEKDFNEIYNTHGPKVYRLCLGYASGDEDLARDWMQESFIRVWNHRKSFKGESAIGTWIYRIAVNTCLVDIRKRKKHPPVREDRLSGEIDADPWGTQDDQIAKLYECIEQLNEQNKVLILMELEDIPQATIAQTVGLAYGSLRTRLSRIRTALLKCITHEK